MRSDEAYVWVSKEPGRYSFNTRPLARRVADECALAYAEDGRRVVRVYRAAAGGSSFLTDDLLMEIRS